VPAQSPVTRFYGPALEAGLSFFNYDGPIRVAFLGPSRCGHDSASAGLVKMGLTEANFGFLIKEDLNLAIRERFGFSAHTEKDDEKKVIRPILETWGKCASGLLLNEFYSNLPEHAVLPRIFDRVQCEMWRANGGIVIEIVRTGISYATGQERADVEECRKLHLVDALVVNESGAENWQENLHRDVACAVRSVIKHRKEALI
jgi:hypothetical protein